jgi:hypothetical protein
MAALLTIVHGQHPRSVTSSTYDDRTLLLVNTPLQVTLHLGVIVITQGFAVAYTHVHQGNHHRPTDVWGNPCSGLARIRQPFVVEI